MYLLIIPTPRYSIIMQLLTVICRQTGQNTSAEVSKRDLKRELDDKEKKGNAT